MSGSTHGVRMPSMLTGSAREARGTRWLGTAARTLLPSMWVPGRDCDAADSVMRATWTEAPAGRGVVARGGWWERAVRTALIHCRSSANEALRQPWARFGGRAKTRALIVRNVSKIDFAAHHFAMSVRGIQRLHTTGHLVGYLPFQSCSYLEPSLSSENTPA